MHEPVASAESFSGYFVPDGMTEARASAPPHRSDGDIRRIDEESREGEDASATAFPPGESSVEVEGLPQLMMATLGAGLVAGIVGMGGTTILSPIVMSMGVSPQVTAVGGLSRRWRRGPSAGSARRRTAQAVALAKDRTRKENPGLDLEARVSSRR